MPKANLPSARKIKRIMEAEARREAKRANGGMSARELRRAADLTLAQRRLAAERVRAAEETRQRDIENKARRAHEAEQRLAAARLAAERIRQGEPALISDAQLDGE